jgi:predicted dehydrogenase
VTNPDIDIVVVATPTDSHAEISIAALKHHKHVLCEKPLARQPSEARKMVRAAESRSLKLKTGFNHRFHAAVFKAHELAARGEIGRLLFARCIYGHGGRAGYEREWRMNPEISGGGQLVDQGIHALDLFRWFLGDFSEVTGFLGTLFWPIGPVEDNAFAILRTRQGCVAQLHASWTQWKNRFSFEVYGEKGYLLVNGLGGNYGTEQLTVGKRTQVGARPDERTEEFTRPDNSWQKEWEEFLGSLRKKSEPLGNGRDGYEALRLVQAIYKSAATRRAVRL